MVEAVSLTFEGHASTDLAPGFRMLPFAVPADTSRLEIAYRCWSDLSFGLRPDENPHDYVADLAVFDPHGADFMGQGFRGSSGNSRSTVFIAPDDATPGYTPGPLYLGEWQIMLGFYKVAPSGCNYQVTVHLTPGRSQPTTALPVRLPLRLTSNRPANASGWYKGELHCHTVHSDGDSDPRAVVQAAERLGLDFLAITDHNTFTHQIVMNQIETDLMLIPGCEVTTFRGHWNIWGDAGWIEFRVTSEDEMETTLCEAIRQGYLTSCNHPRLDGPPWRFPDAEGYQCIEVWNGPWPLLNEDCLNFWETKLKAGQRLVAVGGSDCHHIVDLEEQQLGQPTTVIYCAGDPSPAALLNGLRAGHAYITCTPNGPQIYLTSGAAMMGDAVTVLPSGKVTISVRVVNGNGMQLEIVSKSGIVAHGGIAANEVLLDFDIDAAAALYVRAQLRDVESKDVTALTNPIFFDRPGEPATAVSPIDDNP